MNSELNSDLKKAYVQVLFRFKKTGLDFPKIQDVNLTELFVMAGISNNLFLNKSSINLTEIQNITHITKGAISSMFTSLEKRGYVIRETDKTNRRKITVELTPEGERVIAEAQKQVDAMLEAILSRFGKEKSRQLVLLLNELSDITDEIRKDGLK
jgi:DNA-binding MarR family transcriptional regulator